MKTSAMNRWAQVALFVLGIFVALYITFIVIKTQTEDPRGLALRQVKTKVNVNGHELPVEFLAETRAAGTLTQDEFARLVGATLAEHANRTVTEACASICRAPDGAWGVAPLTVGGHVICPITPHCPKGMVATNVSIHSHPLRKDIHFVANAADAALGGRVGRTMKAGDPEVFSREDLVGVGYVVTYQGALFFQEGRGRVRRLGPVLMP